MRLHENISLFRDAVTATAQKFNIPDIYIEKDYWVTKALQVIFTNEIAPQVVFKGGTALSKCYKLIERFSEDIDLVTLRSEEETGGQLKKKLKDISQVVHAVMPETDIPGITNKLGMIRKTAHEYPKLFSGNYHHVRDKVIIEPSWLGHYEPHHTLNINSFIYEVMLQSDQHDLISEYDMAPFAVQVLDVRRTLCEKILSLVRFSQMDDPIENLRMKIRHTYDLHQMLLSADLRKFFQSVEFDTMLIRVGHDDMECYRSNNDWLKISPHKAIIFDQPKEIWAQLEKTYMGAFSQLVYGNLPSSDEILATIQRIANRLMVINWEKFGPK